ncbi:dihydroorotase [Christensenellaceae bacterium NSJ-44]|uniref:Dihydroorotase n=1 Tax=Luoshenia tenuis TaxID=2763654 RepID=A0A926HMN5_9FIRM|nr:dihydroorotase [Luoshenia tenuis]MBC8528770.1 dihydroorotase [Luoshenia tenuis]
MKLLIKGARVVDPSQKIDGVLDVLIEEGKIAKIAPNIDYAAGEVVDADGLTLIPGLVDIHCHLRDPGLEYKEDIVSGTKAAARGGFTSVCCMANTKPVADNPAVIAYIRDKAKNEGAVHVYPIGAASKGLEGKELAEIGEMKRAGAVAISDDGKPIMNTGFMRLAMEYAADFGLKVLDHCEDSGLVDGGVMNEGYVSTKLGLRGSVNVAEEIHVARDILLCEQYGLSAHICHVSTKRSVEMVRLAKKRGIKITCETAPHYLAATDTWVAEKEYDTATRVNPPLRTKEDQEELIKGLCDGTIDCIATDHAPHHRDEKMVEYDLAASGISGFETAFQLCYQALVLSGKLDVSRLIALMTVQPAQILGLPAGTLAVGAAADIALVDLDCAQTIRVEDFLSKGKNSPFDGMAVTGRVVHTLVDGEWVYRDGCIAPRFED